MSASTMSEGAFLRCIASGQNRVVHKGGGMGFWGWLKQASKKEPAKTAIVARLKPQFLPLTEDRLLALLQEQNFFPLAKLSYRQNFTWRARARGEHLPSKQRKNKQRKAEREKAAILHDHPPY